MYGVGLRSRFSFVRVVGTPRFDGIQLVLSCDFLQLPSIEDKRNLRTIEAMEKEGGGAFRYTSNGSTGVNADCMTLQYIFD